MSTDILLEYEEKLTDIFLKETPELIISSFALLTNVKKIDIHFQLNLITADIDDNKFADCAFSGNVHFLVTNDKHFNALKLIPFPVINIVSLEDFKQLLVERDNQLTFIAKNSFNNL